jgi:hypothetical protein
MKFLAVFKRATFEAIPKEYILPFSGSSIFGIELICPERLV